MHSPISISAAAGLTPQGVEMIKKVIRTELENGWVSCVIIDENGSVKSHSHEAKWESKNVVDEEMIKMIIDIYDSACAVSPEVICRYEIFGTHVFISCDAHRCVCAPSPEYFTYIAMKEKRIRGLGKEAAAARFTVNIKESEILEYNTYV